VIITFPKNNRSLFENRQRVGSQNQA